MSAEDSGHLADPTHSTGFQPKEFDKVTSVDGDATPINDPNYDTISEFSKTTRENTGLFGVSTMSEACDQCCRVAVKEKSTEQYEESFSPDSQKTLF